ncbi:hypothetical protein PYK79_56960, partial [Streptomyces sp. ID05-04B]|uniref:hypothetical protein n=1 Tax=Streptomyces sp. ID05-04B TaxID=3028661 RepID=UPI0029C2693C
RTVLVATWPPAWVSATRRPPASLTYSTTAAVNRSRGEQACLDPVHHRKQDGQQRQEQYGDPEHGSLLGRRQPGECSDSGR